MVSKDENMESKKSADESDVDESEVSATREGESAGADPVSTEYIVFDDPLSAAIKNVGQLDSTSTDLKIYQYPIKIDPLTQVGETIVFDSTPSSLQILQDQIDSDPLRLIGEQVVFDATEPLTIPVDDQFVAVSQALSDVNIEPTWESLVNNNSFQEALDRQATLTDSITANNTIREILEQQESLNSTKFWSSDSLAENLASFPDIDTDKWSTLLQGPTTLDLDAQIRATAAAERYIDFGRYADSASRVVVLPEPVEDEIDEIEEVELIEDDSDIEDVDPMELRQAIASLVKQTQGIHTTTLKVITGDRGSEFSEFGFEIGVLSDEAARITVQSVIDEREVEEGRNFEWSKALLAAVAVFLGGLVAGGLFF